MTSPPMAPEERRLRKEAGPRFDASKLKADFMKRIPEVALDRIMAHFKLNKELKDTNVGCLQPRPVFMALTISYGRW
jgi:hypothetical protein